MVGACPTALAHQESENPKAGTKRARCQFDMSDAEEFEDAEADTLNNDTRENDLFFFDCVDGLEPSNDEGAGNDGAKVVPEASGFVEVKKRRVHGKTKAADTIGLPINPQISKEEQRRLKGIENERKRNQGI